MNQDMRMKVLLSVVLVTVAALAYSSVLDTVLDSMPITRTINRECAKYLDNWTAKSIATFGVSKTVNAALSVIEDSEIQVSAFNVAAGEIVRPLNDMVARVSTVAFAGAVSLGVQRLLIEVGAAVGLKWFVTLAMALLVATVWLNWPPVRRLAYGLLVLALVARILVPVAVFATGKIGDEFTANAQVKAQQRMEQLQAELRKADVLKAADGDTNLVDKFKHPLREAQKAVDRMSVRLATTADAYTEVAITLIAVFIFQTMLMPVLLLWGLIKLLGYLFGPGVSASLDSGLMPRIRRSGSQARMPTDASEVVPEA